MRVSRSFKLFVSFSLIIGTFSILSLVLAQKTYALSGGEFQAGRIIDDSVFFNPNSMSEGQIQEFLNAKVPVCDTNGTKPYAGTTRAAYGTSKGAPPPYICLKDYSQMTTMKNPEDMLCNGHTAGQKTAARIIKEVADSCGVSPKVLLVLLQKEQSLVTDDWPWPIQYRSATGYGCPDTAPCDTQYYGFFNQVYNAARIYKYYAKYPNSFNHLAGRNNNILYHPNSGCGRSTIYIQNQATAGLYNYTPYQPNATALNNLYGTGDSCSSYGNRNFWRMFNDWFGTTTGPDFYAQYHSQSPYPVINSGASRTVYFQFKNIGRAFWKDDASKFPGYLPVRMATTFPINRWSAFRASNWHSPSRSTGFFSKVYESDGATLASDQHTVQPGQIARFEFTFYASPDIPGGVYREYFQPIVDGAPNPYWDMGAWAYLDVGVHKPTYRASFHSQSPYPTIVKGSSANVFIRFKNTGPDPWLDDSDLTPGKQPIHLATSWPINRKSDFRSFSWPFASRPNLKFSKVYENDGITLASAQHTVQPGQIAEFSFDLTVPADTPSGFYKEYFEPIVEGAPGYSWNMGITAWLGVTVP